MLASNVSFFSPLKINSALTREMLMAVKDKRSFLRFPDLKNCLKGGGLYQSISQCQQWFTSEQYSIEYYELVRIQVKLGPFSPLTVLSHVTTQPIVTPIKGSQTDVKTCFSAALLWQPKITGASLPSETSFSQR